jgi:hypothetical protein
VDINERNKALEARRKVLMESDFSPGYTPESMPNPEHRLANAADYAAYQLGQINRNLAKLVALMEKRGS